MVPPRRSSRHYQSERLENESWRSGSTSYDGEPFSSRPSQVSDSMTLDNPTTYENSRHFPPRLPTAPPFSDTHRRSDATKKIQSWINRHERSQAARRHRDGGEEDSSYHSDDSQSSSGESITSSQGFDRGVGALWRELKVRRRRLRDLKDTMAQKRSNLKALRPKMYEADNAFMSAIRPTLVNKGTLRQTPMEEVDRRFAEMQRLRTECQDLETGYEELEDTVDGQEAQLERVEVRFFSLLGSGYDSESVAPMVAPDKALSDNVPHELRGIAAEKPVEDLHPLFVQLTLAVANLRNGQEELGNLLSMKSQCDEAVTVKKRLRQKIPKDLDDFLADFPSREASKRKEILQNEQEVSRFRQLCLEKDIMAKHMSLEMTFMFNPKSEAEDIKLADKTSILSNRETLAHPVFSTLLSQPDHLLEKPIPLTPTGALEKAVNMPDDDTRKQLKVLRAKKEMAIHSLMKDRNQGGGTAELINRWILFNLRNSPIDVVKLFTIFTSKLSVKNVLLWQRDVLHFWYRDGTGAAIDRYRDFDGDSEYYSRVGTPPRTRAASEGAGSRRLVRHHCRARSGGAVTYTAL